jgi:hypothetical protein
MVMRPSTLAEIPASAWAPPPAGFKVVLMTRPDRAGRIAGDFEAEIEESRRPFRIASPGALVIGFEKYRRFTAPLPPGLRLEGWRVSEALTANPSATVGLVAGDLRDVPKESGLLNRGFDRVPSLYCVGSDAGHGGMASLPPEGQAVGLGSFNRRDLVEGSELWAVIEELLAAGFTPEDLDLFSSSPKVTSVALPACALEIVTKAHKAMRPRETEDLMRSLAGKLKRWAKTDLTSPFAVALFDEAVTNAVAGAKPSELPALVGRLLPTASAEAAGAEK